MDAIHDIPMYVTSRLGTYLPALSFRVDPVCIASSHHSEGKVHSHAPLSEMPPLSFIVHYRPPDKAKRADRAGYCLKGDPCMAPATAIIGIGLGSFNAKFNTYVDGVTL